MTNKVLYQIRSLEKLLFRRYMDKKGINEMDMSKFNPQKVITPTQMNIIDYMIKNKNRAINQNELEHVLNLRRATVSGVLHTMETNGLIQRSTDENDTRKKQLKLNDKAVELFNEKKSEVENLENDLIEGISEEELNSFFSVIEKMKENMKK